MNTDVFTVGDKVKVSGRARKRFQGVMRRHNFSGVGGTTHGQSDRLRAPGSIGSVLIHPEFSKVNAWLEEWVLKIQQL